MRISQSKSRRDRSFSRTQALMNSRKSGVIEKAKKSDDYLLIVNEYSTKQATVEAHPLFDSQKRLAKLDQVRNYAPMNSPVAGDERLESPQPRKFLSKRLS